MPAEPKAAGSVSEWRRLSAWSIAHFSARAVVQNVRAVLAFGAGAYGISVAAFDRITWIAPAAIIFAVLVHAVLNYVFYRFRLTADAVLVRSGAFFRKDLNLPFERIQNITLEHPFYFRPLGLVTLRIDGAGSAGEEVPLAALGRAEAEAIRAYIVSRRGEAGAAAVDDHDAPADVGTQASAMGAAAGQPFFTRSLSDLVIHGLTNNRAFLVIAATVGVIAQSDRFHALIASYAARVGELVGSFSAVYVALLFVLCFILAIGVIGLLSVAVSIVGYYGFSIYRTPDSLTVAYGLFTKHEIHVRKSRIQTISLVQDWLDYLLERRNIVLEQISHGSLRNADAGSRQRILVPSVRLDETASLLDEVLPDCRVDALEYTPIARRWFYKFAIIGTALHALLLLPPLILGMPAFVLLLVVLAWPAHMALIYMTWKRAGIAIDGGLVVARSGTIGIKYQVFPAFKAQDISHAQSVLMRRRGLSTFLAHTASSTIRVPYLPTALVRQLVDYCAYEVAVSERSWM